MKEEARILIIDDDADVLASLKILLKQYFTFVKTLSNTAAIASALREVKFDVVLLDMNLEPGENDGMAGIRLLDMILTDQPELEVLPLTAYGDIDLAVDAVKRGARDFMTKPWDNQKLVATIRHILSEKGAENSSDTYTRVQVDSGLLIGKSKSFLRAMEIVRKVSRTDASILVVGENGTGKNLIVEAIHQLSPRAEKALVHVDLGALNVNIIESELFGHKKGAFTDAYEDKEGKFLAAHGSTIFLDEIGNLPLASQAKLLSVLQHQKFTPVGSNKTFSIDTRIISATNVDLEEKVRSGEFRQDLLYRLNTIEIRVPPLRERKEDIPLLLQHYLQVFKDQYEKTTVRYEKEVIQKLMDYAWPGNVRELAQAVERAVILTDSVKLNIKDFPQLAQPRGLENSLDLKEMEKSMILRALEKNKGNITHAAKDLGIDRLALYRRLEKYGL